MGSCTNHAEDGLLQITLDQSEDALKLLWEQLHGMGSYLSVEAARTRGVADYLVTVEKIFVLTELAQKLEYHGAFTPSCMKIFAHKFLNIGLITSCAQSFDKLRFFNLSRSVSVSLINSFHE